MNYYYDTEFLEGTQDKRVLGIKYGKSKPTINLISIGIISEDDREYYAISKDFNLKEAWNRHDLIWEQSYGDMRMYFPKGITKKVYWIRDNVLKPIFDDHVDRVDFPFNYRNMKTLIEIIGKTNKEIAEEVFQFVTQDSLTIEKAKYYGIEYENINLYGYYSAYDHVALSWLFGKMIDLPQGFPMYTKDLKQIYDEKEKSLRNEEGKIEIISPYPIEGDPDLKIMGIMDSLKDSHTYPKQQDKHNALADAKWNKKLHEFLNTI